MFAVAGLAASWISGACMMPTSVLPSGVIASPSMPLLATRPELLPLISVAPCADKLATSRLAGRVKVRVSDPVARSNWRT